METTDAAIKPLKFIPNVPEDRLFIQVLRKRIDEYFETHKLSKKGNFELWSKSILLIALYILPFVSYLYLNPSYAISILLWILMALGMAGIGMSIMHDANHGAYSENFSTNQFVGLVINAVGGMAFNWKIQHNILHHTYTNIVHYDDDIDDKAILKLSPHTKAKWYHRYQYIYAFLFYAIATLYWCTAKDFLQLIRYSKEKLNQTKGWERISLWSKLILSKILYFSILLGIPYYVGINGTKTLICFIIMHIVAGSILTIVFQLAHTIEGTSHPLPSSKLTIENEWAIHQMQTTANFATSNKIISWFVGGLNFQIEHHLFPQVSHVHYSRIAPIVKETANEFQIPYLEFSNLNTAIRAHIKTLKRFGEG